MSGWSPGRADHEIIGGAGCHAPSPHFSYRLPTPSLRTEYHTAVSIAAAGVGEVHAADGVLPGEGHRLAVAVADVDRDAAGAGIGPAHDAVDRRVDRLAGRVPVDPGQIERVLVLPETVLVLVGRAVVALHDRPLTAADRPDDPARAKVDVVGRCGTFHLAFLAIAFGPVVLLQIGRRDLEIVGGDPADLLAVLHLIEALLRSR